MVCHDVVPGEPCYFSVHWAKTVGIFDHPEWYPGLAPDSTLAQFQLVLHKQGAENCTSAAPCGAEALEKQLGASEAAPAARQPAFPLGPRAQTFYMYRAQSEAVYPLENINAADLAGVFWYLHREVVGSTPRKYKIDRIKRFKVTVKNTWEFWNAHKRQFGAFVAYDAGRCTTPVCKDMYHQYGFIVGCQVQPLSVAAYTSRSQTNWQCKAGEDECKAPIWYSLPGPCPSLGLSNDEISQQKTNLDVNKYKTPECLQRMPGGHCPPGLVANGDPTCTYSYEEAGEIFLDELVGIGDYEEFWKFSYTKCADGVAQGTLPASTVCVHNKEYDFDTDEGVGTSFWNGRQDKAKCAERMEKARALFRAKFPQYPDLEEPACEFDMFYDNEFSWEVNHTGATHSDWWSKRM